ncbi:MAG: helix-turn-helix domain-containing protein [Omnitrophica bacterium]|nr:helix-turn-helix domain-containing protein [Candidatus Omnitrophota bacterium]
MLKHLILSRDIVEKYNIPYSTITHYTNMGFFTVVSRKGNKRLYSEDEVKVKLERITNLVHEGYPLRLIRKMLGEAGQ